MLTVLVTTFSVANSAAIAAILPVIACIHVGSQLDKLFAGYFCVAVGMVIASHIP